MSISPQIPRSPRKEWIANTNISNKRSCFILTMINFLLQTVNPNNTFSIRFKNLLDKYSNVDINAMGFPINWQSEVLWKG